MRILLACSAGTSTSLLEESVKDYFKIVNISGFVKAYGSDTALKHVNEFDVVLLGPQVRHRLEEFMSASLSKKVDCITRGDFITSNGKNIVDQALELLKL